MSIENRNLGAFNLYPLAEVLKERLSIEGDGDIEKGLEREVVDWIAVRPQKEHTRNLGRKTLALLSGPTIATALIYGFSNQYVPGVHIEALTLSTTLVVGGL